MRRRIASEDHKHSNNGVPEIENFDFNTGSKVWGEKEELKEEYNDRFNYALLLLLYTLQGIPMGLSASIPFLIQQKIKNSYVSQEGEESIARLTYNAQAIFALCSWPFSLKLLWAPLVDAAYIKRIGRRKSWLVPCQFAAGFLMIFGSNFMENQLGEGRSNSKTDLNVKSLTFFFFALYFLMATQDIAVDGWALTMLSKKNRERGPVCNSIGQNFGYFLSFVGFLALNDPDSSENVWRPLLGYESKPGIGLVSLGSFIYCMGIFMLGVTILVAFFKKENDDLISDRSDDEDDNAELDASKIGISETYLRLWAVACLAPVQKLFIILLTFRLPTALSDNVKFLKAVEFGLSKQTTALLSPFIILPLGIIVPIIAAKIWRGRPLQQFLTAYKFRISLVPILDVCMLLLIRFLRGNISIHHSMYEKFFFWFLLYASTACQAIASSLQFNAQMIFFASRVDPSIGGSYMTLLNTASNLGGTWPSSVTMYLVGQLTIPPKCEFSQVTNETICKGGRDAYFILQTLFSILGCIWLFLFSDPIKKLAKLPEDAWKTKYFKDWARIKLDLRRSYSNLFRSVRNSWSKNRKP